MHLEFAPIEFKVIAALLKLSKTFRTDIEYRHRACACGAVLQTKDDKYLMVELSGKSMNPNKYDYVGGNVEFPHPLSNGDDLFQHLYREAKEEINVDPADFSELSLKAVIQSKGGYVIFHFQGTLNLTSDKVTEKFKAVKDPDISRVIFFDRDEYIRFLSESRRMLDGVVRALV